MTLARKGLILAAFQCVLVLSVTGKLLYDRETCPRVWVRTERWDPNLPIRGRYLTLTLAPEWGARFYAETRGQRVLFFVPEHRLPQEHLWGTGGSQLWAEVTIPRKGPPRPIHLAVKEAGQMRILDIQ